MQLVVLLLCTAAEAALGQERLIIGSCFGAALSACSLGPLRLEFYTSIQVK
jgi:hypothetical protein